MTVLAVLALSASVSAGEGQPKWSPIRKQSAAARKPARPAAAAATPRDSGASPDVAPTPAPAGSQLKWRPRRPEAAARKAGPAPLDAADARPIPPPAPRRKATANVAPFDPPAAGRATATIVLARATEPVEAAEPALYAPPKNARPASQTNLRAFRGAVQQPVEEDESTLPEEDDAPLTSPNDNGFTELREGSGRAPGQIVCADEYNQLKPIGEVDRGIEAPPGNVPDECPLQEEDFEPRAWAQTTFVWKASGLCHKPLYFEEVALERYGHSFGPLVQPIVSGAHFFAMTPLLPYKMGIEPPWECIYPLGYGRPGNCMPYMFQPFPLSLRGAAAQAGVVTGFVTGFP